MNNAETRIELASDCIELWEKICRFEEYKTKTLIAKLKEEYYAKIHKLIAYEYEVDNVK